MYQSRRSRFGPEPGGKHEGNSRDKQRKPDQTTNNGPARLATKPEWSSLRIKPPGKGKNQSRLSDPFPAGLARNAKSGGRTSLPMLEALGKKPFAATWRETDVNGARGRASTPDSDDDSSEMDEWESDDDFGFGDVSMQDLRATEARREDDSDELRQTLRKLQRGPLLTGPLDELEAARALYEQSDNKCYELFVSMLGDGMAAEMIKCIETMKQRAEIGVKTITESKSQLCSTLNAQNDEVQELLARLQDLEIRLLELRQETKEETEQIRQTTLQELQSARNEFHSKSSAIRKQLPAVKRR